MCRFYLHLQHIYADVGGNVLVDHIHHKYICWCRSCMDHRISCIYKRSLDKNYATQDYVNDIFDVFHILITVYTLTCHTFGRF